MPPALPPTWSGAVTTSSHAIALGVALALGDALVQYVTAGTRITVHSIRKEIWGEADEDAPRPAWAIGRTFTAFVVGASTGAAFSLVTMTFIKRLDWASILVNIVPTELMLLPFQGLVVTGGSRHFARNVPGYMLLVTLADLVVGYPVLIWGLVAPGTALGLPQLLAMEVRIVLVGLSALGIFMFANRYPGRQWAMEVSKDAEGWVRAAHPVLIVTGHVAGNVAWAFLVLYAVFSNRTMLPNFVTIPLMCFQFITNIHMQLVAAELPPGVRMLRVFVPILTIPAAHLQNMSALQESFNALALCSYTLWVASFQDEWRELYDQVEGGLDRPDSFLLNAFIDPAKEIDPPAAPESKTA